MRRVKKQNPAKHIYTNNNFGGPIFVRVHKLYLIDEDVKRTLRFN